MNISGPAAVAKPEMLFYAPGDLTVTMLFSICASYRTLSSKSRPSWTVQIPGNKITPPRRMVLLVSPWHSFEHTQYSTLGFTPKSQNRANVVAELRQLTYSILFR